MSAFAPIARLYVVLPLLLAVVWGASWLEIERDRGEEIHDGRTAAVFQAHAFAENTLSSIKRLNELLLDLRAHWRGDWKHFSDTIRQRGEHISDLTFQIGIIDADGYLAFSNLAPARERTYLGDREHFRVHRDGGGDRLFVSKPIKGRVSGKWTIQFTRPILDNGQFRGVIVASVSPDNFIAFHRKLDLGRDAMTSIVRDSGEIMARHPRGDEFLGQTVAAPHVGPGTRPSGSFLRASQLDGIERVFGYYRLPEYGLSFVVGESLDTLLEPHQRHRRTVIVNAAAVSALLLVFSFLLHRSIVARERARALLRDSEEQQRLLGTAVAQSNSAVLVTATDGSIVFVNDAFVRTTGYSRAEAIGNTPSLLKSGLTDPAVYRELWATITAGKPWQGELQNRSRSGEIYWESVKISPVFDAAGKTTHFIGVQENVSGRKAAEAALRDSEAFRVAILDSMAAQIAVLDRDGVIVAVNEPWRRFVLDNGALAAVPAPSLAAGSNYLAACRADAAAAPLAAGIAAVLAGEMASFADEYSCRLDDGPHWFGVTVTPLGTAGYAVLSQVDISPRIAAEESLRRAASVFTHAREGIMITDATGTIVEVNDAFVRITGYRRDEAIGSNPRLLKSGRHPPAFYEKMWHDLLAKGYWSGEVWNRRSNGEAFVEFIAISSVRDPRGVTQNYVALFSDITQQKEHQEQLEHIAHFDALTNLPNRLLLGDRLRQAIAQAQRRQNRLAVAYLDLDGFKTVNDRHGHEVGDRLLLSLGARLKQSLREGDTFARLGGDEFVAVLIDLPDDNAAVPLVLRLLQAAASPVAIDDFVLQVSASIGLSFYPQNVPVDADQLLRQADQAMYQAKLDGMNRYHVFDTEIDRSVRSVREGLDDIRRGLNDGEFVLHYQPKVDMGSGEVVGAEALIRWQHPQRGLLAPLLFLPLTETQPLAIDIGEWVIATALAQMAAWRRAGLDLPVSVNVGARQLQQADFVERLSAILARHPEVPPQRLELEVLETSALEDIEHVSRLIRACHAIGVGFALDDFGTGYSSLTYLKRLPAARLKIDQSFVGGMVDDPEDLAILEGVVGLATAFRRDLIAEGVETVEHGVMLLRLGCRFAQGFGIGRPMPAARFVEWQAGWRADPAWLRQRQWSRDELPLLFAGVEYRAWLRAIADGVGSDDELSRPAQEHRQHAGSWLAGDGKARYGRRPAFRAITELQRQVDALEAELFALKAAGRGADAAARLGELAGLRDALLAELETLAQQPAVEVG